MTARRQVIDGAVQERDFFGDVMAVVRQIPKGRVTSYGAIARYLGKHHFATPTAMEELLAKEGVKVVNDQVQDFAKRYWDPALELDL